MGHCNNRFIAWCRLSFVCILFKLGPFEHFAKSDSTGVGLQPLFEIGRKHVGAGRHENKLCVSFSPKKFRFDLHFTG